MTAANSAPERLKLDSAERFVEAARQRGMNVRLETKLNRKALTDILETIAVPPAA